MATNVADARAHSRTAQALLLTPDDARERLGIPNRFTVLFAGSLDVQKRPDIIPDVAALLPYMNFVIAGRGPLAGAIERTVEARGLQNVFLVGHVGAEMPTWFRASNALALPGRGGIVLSEAMAHGVVPVVFQADGTEFDLVQDGMTGIRVYEPTAEAFARGLEVLRENPELNSRLRDAGRALVVEDLNMENMVKRIVSATMVALARRQGNSKPDPY